MSCPFSSFEVSLEKTSSVAPQFTTQRIRTTLTKENLRYDNNFIYKTIEKKKKKKKKLKKKKKKKVEKFEYCYVFVWVDVSNTNIMRMWCSKHVYVCSLLRQGGYKVTILIYVYLCVYVRWETEKYIAAKYSSGRQRSVYLYVWGDFDRCKV